MNDFLKIFFTICALVAAFLFGRNYGEKTFKEGEEYKTFAKANDELNYAKSELENAKAKLQNIIDSAETKKTDELLGQILQVFLADLGLRIQNRDAILKQAQTVVVAHIQAPAPPPEIKNSEQFVKKADAPVFSKQSLNKLKSFEWMLQNSSGGRDTFKDLSKVTLKNLKQSEGEEDLSKAECDSLLGVYRGSVMDINNNHFGSIVFEFHSEKQGDQSGYSGTISWYNESNSAPMSQIFSNTCGKKIDGLAGRIFYFSSDRFLQIYKLGNVNKIAGLFYEILPNKTTKEIGAFVLGRTDRL